ncbi:MAG: OmpA family protein [Alphaproteobacteria bacterium]|nr:OmpA family protein [Alphaproteobacteria bacterium]
MAVAVARRRRGEEEGESVFVSMTDLTVSFLFILLILLAFFATQFQPEDMVPLSEHDTLKHEALELAGRLVEANKIQRQLEDALARERGRLHQVEQERRELTDRLAAAEGKIAELREELALAAATIDKLLVQIEALRREIELTRTEPDDARTRLADLLNQVEKLERLLEGLRKERDRLREQLFEMAGLDSLAAYLESASKAREALLERLANQIRRRLPGIQVSVDTTDGVIRFRADELFPTGTWRIPLDSLAERVSHAVGDALAETLPCYTLSPDLDTEVSCEGAVAAIETIQIEGHTDDVALSPELQSREQMRDNYDLSARRGAETLRVMTRDRPELRHFLNLRRQPVLSFAGYGETRPINPDDTDEAKAQNRRIDIRFILQTPRNLLQVKEIRSQLTRRRTDLPTVVDEPRP